jgi:hypothetical protein
MQTWVDQPIRVRLTDGFEALLVGMAVTPTAAVLAIIVTEDGSMKDVPIEEVVLPFRYDRRRNPPDWIDGDDLKED